MQMRVGYELIYDCQQRIPMILTLNIHHTRLMDIVVPDHLRTDPSVPVAGYRDGFGNWCSRIVAPPGRIRITADAIVNDTGQPDAVAPSAQQIPVEDLPEKTLVFLLRSRYCETDRLSEAAWDLFGNSPPGWGRVQAICDFVHNHIVFGYEHASSSKTAWDVFNERKGVCRDYAHLAIAFLPFYELSGTLLHRLPGRYRRAALGIPKGLLRLVRGLPWRSLVYLRCPSQRAADRPRADRTRSRCR